MRTFVLVLLSALLATACQPAAVTPANGPRSDGKPAQAAVLAAASPKDPPVAKVTLQQLIDQAPDESTIVVPRATYLSVTSTVIRNRKNLVLQFEPGATVLVEDVDYAVLQIDGSTNIAVRSARMRHVRPLTNYACHGPVVAVGRSQNIYVDNCELNGCGAIGVSARETKDLTIQHCWIHHNTFNAIYLSECKDVKILANLVENNANFLQLHACDFVELSDNFVRRNGGYWQPADLEPGLRTDLPAEATKAALEAEAAQQPVASPAPAVKPTPTPVPTSPPAAVPTTQPAAEPEPVPVTPPTEKPAPPPEEPATQPAIWVPTPVPASTTQPVTGESLEELQKRFIHPTPEDSSDATE